MVHHATLCLFCFLLFFISSNQRSIYRFQTASETPCLCFSTVRADFLCSRELLVSLASVENFPRNYHFIFRFAWCPPLTISRVRRLWIFLFWFHDFQSIEECSASPLAVSWENGTLARDRYQLVEVFGVFFFPIFIRGSGGVKAWQFEYETPSFRFCF